MTLLDDVYRQKANIKNIRERQRSERVEAIYKKYPELFRLENEKNNVLNELTSMNFSNYEDINKKILDIEAKKQKLIEDYGLEDAFKVQYECPKCEDTGIYQSKRCSCIDDMLREKMLEANELNTEMRQKSFESFDANVFSDEKEGDAPSTREYMLAIKKSLEDYADNFHNEAKSILFYGDVGTGKSFMAVSLAKRLIEKLIKVTYIGSYEMCQVINDAIFKGDDAAIAKRDMYYNTDFLIIDDLGTEIDTQVSSKSILDLVNYRLSKNLKTLITSNLNVDAIKEKYGERLSSRLLSNYYIYRFRGRDLRLR